MPTLILLLKYLPALLKMKDVAADVRAETGAEKPAIVSRRAVGGVVAVVLGAVAVYTGTEMSGTQSAQITDNIMSVISACGALYGAAMVIVGQIRKGK